LGSAPVRRLRDVCDRVLVGQKSGAAVVEQGSCGYSLGDDDVRSSRRQMAWWVAPMDSVFDVIVRGETGELGFAARTESGMERAYCLRNLDPRCASLNCDIIQN
jgi:hypothetical protein